MRVMESSDLGDGEEYVTSRRPRIGFGRGEGDLDGLAIGKEC